MFQSQLDLTEANKHDRCCPQLDRCVLFLNVWLVQMRRGLELRAKI